MNSSNESINYSGVYQKDTRNLTETQGISSNQKSLNLQHSKNIAEFSFGKCLVDYSGRQYVCLHDQCNEHKSCFNVGAQDGICDFQALNLHPEDQALLCDKVFPDVLKFMEQVTANERSDYRLSFNHRYIRRDGSVSQFLQEGTLTIPVDGGLPVLNLRLFAEIGDFKSDDTMVLSIFRHYADKGNQKVWTKVYSNNDSPQLSRREIEIIRLCLEGLSSKMIANKLNLSIHTVKNHKRNCMEKTLTHNITQLIHLCMRSNLL